MSKRISKEELSDQQIQDIIEEFSNLTEEQRKQRLLGEGAYKSAYDIPGTSYVLKKPHGTEAAINDMAREYAVNKRLRDKVDLETPILVSRKVEDKVEPFHIQRKIVPLETKVKKEITSDPRIRSLSDQQNFLKQLRDRLWELRSKALDEKDIETAKKYAKDWQAAYDQSDAIEKSIKEVQSDIKKPSFGILDKVISKLESADLSGADIHEGNVTPEGKVFDLGSWVGYNYAQDAKNKPLIETRKAVVGRTISNPKFLGKYGIYRSLLPMLAKGAAVGAGGLASLAAEASDAEDEGSAPEEAAMQREAQDRKFRKSVGEDAYQKSQQLMQDMGPQDLIDKDAQKSQFRILRNKLK